MIPARMFPPKDPDDALDYSFEWSSWLAAGDVITSSVFDVIPDDLTQPVAPTFSDDTATVWLAGGTAGAEYAITNRITTAAGRVKERTAFLQVKER